MSLYEFCHSPEHFVARERLLHMEAALDMKLHAACNLQLQMTEPEIDNEGYDFTVVLGYDLLYIQNKATLSDASVTAWEIHPTLLQASFADRDIAPVIDGLPVGGYGAGASGGVLLHVIDAVAARDNEFRVSYYYFDVFFAAALALGIWKNPGFT